MTKKALLFLGVAVAVAVAALAWGAWTALRPAPRADALVLYGNVDVRQVSLAFNGSERIATLSVQEGERVRAGQVLGTLDTVTLRLRLDQAQAQAGVQQQALQRLHAGSRPEEVAQARAHVAAAQADAELAARQLERLRAVRETTAGRAASQQDLEAAQSRRQVALAQLDGARQAERLAVIGPRKEDIAQAQAQLAASQANAALLTQQLADAQLKAPIDAVVRARLMEPGDMASPQRPVYTLVITEPKWVRVYVAEADLGRLRPGMAARVRTDSQPQDALAGQVGYIASVAEFTPKTVQTEALRSSLVYEVRVNVADPEDRLRLGMPATVEVPLRSPPQGTPPTR